MMDINITAQKDMIPIWGDEASEGSFDEMVAAECGASKEDVVSTDLFLYNRMPGTVWGAQKRVYFKSASG